MAISSGPFCRANETHEMHRAAAGPFLCGSRNSKNSPEVVPLFYVAPEIPEIPEIPTGRGLLYASEKSELPRGGAPLFTDSRNSRNGAHRWPLFMGLSKLWKRPARPPFYCLA